MQEDTATLKVTLTIKLAGEAGAEGTDQPYISAEEKAETLIPIVKDQAEALRRTYDTGVDVTGQYDYVGRATEDL